MFFTHELLVGPKGRFTLLWRAAVKKDRLKRRQLDALDVAEVCQALIDYIRPRADSRMGNINGFSLRLSAQLIHGVIVCYSWKVGYILDDALSSWKAVVAKRYLLQELNLPKLKVKRSKKNLQIDINFNADPMFGEILTANLEAPHQLALQTTSEESTSTSEGESRKRISSRHTVADISEITMQERVSLYQEVPDLLTCGETVQFDLEDLVPLGPEGPAFLDLAPVSSKEAVPRAITPSASLLPETPKMPKSPKRRKRSKPDDDSILAVPLPKEPVEPVEATPLPDIAEQNLQTMAEQQQPPSSLVLDPINSYELPPAKKRKFRKLIVDAKTKCTSDEMKKRMKAEIRTIEDYKEEELLLEPICRITSDVLFSNPTIHCSGLDTARIEMERTNAGADTNAVRILFRKMIEEISKNPQTSESIRYQGQTEREISVGEVRDESSIQPVRDDTGTREMLPNRTILSNEDSLLPPQQQETHRRKPRVSSLHGESISVSDLGSGLGVSRMDENEIPMDIAQEVSNEGALGLEQMGEEILPRDEVSVLSEVQARWATDDVVTFAMIAPPGVCSRAEAARKFYSLLVHTKNGSVKLKQDGGYADVEIFRP